MKGINTLVITDLWQFPSLCPLHAGEGRRTFICKGRREKGAAPTENGASPVMSDFRRRTAALWVFFLLKYIWKPNDRLTSEEREKDWRRHECSIGGDLVTKRYKLLGLIEWLFMRDSFFSFTPPGVSCI